MASVAWAAARAQVEHRATSTTDELANNVCVLCANQLEDTFCTWILMTARQSVDNDVGIKFWGSFGDFQKNKKQLDADKLMVWLDETFTAAVRSAHASFTEWCRILDIIDGALSSPGGGEPLKSRVTSTLNASLFNMAPDDFPDMLALYFRLQFQRSAKLRGDVDPSADSDDDEKMGDVPSASSQSLPVKELGRLLHELQWMYVAEGSITQMLYQQIQQRITKSCKGELDAAALEPLSAWLRDIVLPWLRELLDVDVGAGMAAGYVQQQTRLQFHLYEVFCRTRIGEMFDIITEFPDSMPALEDLRGALKHTQQNRELVASLRRALAKRLLHPGANTSQIIEVYIATIKALRMLDPTGVLLEAVAEPVKEYLRERKDTVRCIVNSLTNDSNSELFEELGRSGMTQLSGQAGEESEDDEAATPGVNWTPDPIEADPAKTSQSRKTNDILSMLVTIYGSQELFVNEYRLMLADKLLANLDFDTDREVRTIELLKLRFGEDSLHHCEIMVKDVENSKRSLKSIATKKLQVEKDEDEDENESPEAPKATGKIEDELVRATIVSRHFWPLFHNEQLTLHRRAAEHLREFSAAFTVLKNPRQLLWKPHLGSVDLELEFEGSTREFTVTPLMANVIMHFEDRKSWPLPELASTLGLKPEFLRKKVIYWINQGVLGQSKVDGVLVYDLNDSPQVATEHLGVAGEEEDGGGVSADAQAEEEMLVYESYIAGMLTNFGSLPMDRIHNMLKMFVAGGDHTYDKSLGELGAFLQKLVNADKLECADGMYSLQKS